MSGSVPFERGMVSGEIPGPVPVQSPHETPRSNPDAVDRETGLSLRFIREYDASKDVWPPFLEIEIHSPAMWHLLERLTHQPFPVDPNAPPKCCDGINGSHTQLCPAPWQDGTHATVHCWCCGEDHPSHWAGAWSDKGYRCLECADGGCDYHGDGLGCLKIAREARALMGCL